MHTLRIWHDWAQQIELIRNAVTEDTNLIRFDNGFYRVCRSGEGTFEVRVTPRMGGQGIVLDVRERDLYVTRIDGKPFVDYSQMLDTRKPEALALDNAVQELGKATGDRLRRLQSIIILCFAESMRNDHMATRIGQFIRTTTTGILGVPAVLPMADLMDEIHAWGQTSEAIFKVLSPTARDIVLRRRATLTPAQKQFSERVEVARIEADFRAFARSLKVLKRPGRQ